MRMRIAFPLLLVANALICSVAAPAALTVERLRCEHRENPLGVDAERPRLSWWLGSDARGQRQAAYQVLVASSRELLEKDQGDLWDSGRVESEQSTLVPYQGKPLETMRQAWWKVRAWGEKGGGEPSAWSAPATWTMGVLKPGDWRAKWIGYDTAGGDKAGQPPLPLLRKAFTVDRAVRRAVVSVCGLGESELSLNGERVGDHVMDPGWTNYKKRCLYATYDVTQQVRRGENALGAMLGNGMYNVTGGRYVKFKGSFGPPKMILQMRIEFEDGSADWIVSDASWKGAAGPVRFACIYGGEDYDARTERAGWDAPGFDDSQWGAATVMDGPGGALAAQAQPPVKVMEEFKTVKVSEPRPGVLVYDLGRNFSGWPWLKAKGAAGAQVKLIPGELLDKNGLVTQRSSGGPTFFSYTLKGAGEERWSPRFAYYGFRYVQVERQPAAAGGELPEIMELRGRFIHSSAAAAGRFECSNPLINRIHALINAALQSNMQSVLTDCPHREKLGWLEETHLIGQAIMFGYDVPNLYAKISQDMAEAQLESGLVPDIAPEFTVFQNGFRDSPEWGSAAVINPWLVYQMYGDRSLIEKHYGAMARYVDYLGSKAKDHIISYGLGDWYDIGPKPPGVSQLTSLGVTATAVWLQDVEIMTAASAMLGKMQETEKYSELARKIREAFNREFFSPERDHYDRDSQTANAMALALDLAPRDRRAAVAERLVRNIREHGNRVTAGDVGFHYLIAALTAAGRHDLLYDMVTQQTGPGYAEQLKKGATTLTEAWNAGPASSQNHFMLGHAEGWFYEGLGGISPLAPGFGRVRIEPAMVGDLKSARVAYDSVRGRIVSAWRREGGRVVMEVEIPVGVDGVVGVPARSAGDVSESGKPAARAEGVRLVNETPAGKVFFEVGAGRYRFEAVEK